jgi:co-chaperonin GroES (HSP10)
MPTNVNAIKGNLRAIGKRVLVTDMHFGEQVTRGGIIIAGDDGKQRGIYPRWARVYSKGPENNDPYEKNQWVLIEHGRWTRGMKVDTDDEGEITIHMVDDECILAMADEKPNDHQIGDETANGGSVDINPQDFINA